VPTPVTAVADDAVAAVVADATVPVIWEPATGPVTAVADPAVAAFVAWSTGPVI
jgi:hypothetical protein